MKWIVVLLLTAFCGCLPPQPAANSSGGGERKNNSQTNHPISSSENGSLPTAANPTEEEGSPEAVLRAFMIAVIKQDSDELMKLTVPLDDIEILLEGETVPASTVDQMVEMIKVAPLKRMQVGDSVKIPRGKTIVFNKDHVNESLQQFMIPDQPIPIKVVRVGESWKVYPDSIIVIRKAAMEVKARNSNRK